VREEELEWLRRVVELPLIRSGTCQNVWILGEKGVGKSALQLYFMEELRKKVADVDVVYVKLPAKGVADIYRAFIYALGVEYLIKLSVRLYCEYFKYRSYEKLYELCSQIRPKEARPEREVLRETIEKAIVNDEFLQQVISGKGPLHIAALKKIADDMADWLCAWYAVFRKVAKCLANIAREPERQFSSLLRVRGAADMADVIASIARLAKKFLNKRAMLMIIDELEIAWDYLTTSAKNKFAVWLRNMVEASGGWIRIMMTYVPRRESIDALLSKYPHIADVLPFMPPGNVLIVEPLSYEKATELIACYLSRERLEMVENRIKPFEEEVIKELVLRKAGRTRDILYACYVLIEHAAEKGVEKIDMGLLEEYETSIL